MSSVSRGAMSPELLSMPFSVQQSPDTHPRPSSSPQWDLVAASPPRPLAEADHDEWESLSPDHRLLRQQQPSQNSPSSAPDFDPIATPSPSSQASLRLASVDSPWMFVNVGPEGAAVFTSSSSAAPVPAVVHRLPVGFETPSAGGFGEYAVAAAAAAAMSPPSVISSTRSPLDIASTIDGGGTATSFTDTTAPPTTLLHPGPQQPANEPANHHHPHQYFIEDGMSRPEPTAVLTAPSVASLGPGHHHHHSDVAPFGIGTELMMNDLFTDFNPHTFGINMHMSVLDFDTAAQPLPVSESAPWVPGDSTTSRSRQGSVQDSISMVDQILVRGSTHNSTVARCSTSSSAESSSSSSSLDHADRPDATPGSTSGKDVLRRVRSGKVDKLRRSASVDPFVIMTPTSMNAQTGRGGAARFGGLEAIRPTAKGRKGPLAEDTKKGALQVRRMGACFACHSRKVKCDKERPCKNCRRVTATIPQILCWQFPDFIPALFPVLLRGHFQKDAMVQFMRENVANPLVNGEQLPCVINIKSGRTFKTTLTLSARFFTPCQSSEVTEHWHKRVVGDRIMLNCQKSVPVRVDMETNSQREGIKKQIRDYVQNILAEPTLVEQFTNSFSSTAVPRKVLQIVSNYADRSQSAMVRKALGIYAMHYLMTRHLSFTRQTVVNLAPTGLVPQDVEFVTSRMLNRQVKLLLDEVAQREMHQLFVVLAKALKDKSKREWAPCLASFLLLCLFMESVETAVDSYVIAENEISLRRHVVPPFKRGAALSSNQELENLPFRQFAYQFHQVFQTHSRDATTRPFNPLVDDGPLENGDLDPAAKDMVVMLRALLQGAHWQELDFLTMDPILGDTIGQEEHPFPREVASDYQGRLISKFLLSFQHEKYIFTAKA